MIADTSPIGKIGPCSIPTNVRKSKKFQFPQASVKQERLFSKLSWLDQQILLLFFSEELSQWEIHAVLDIPTSEVLCRITRLRIIAYRSLFCCDRA